MTDVLSPSEMVQQQAQVPVGEPAPSPEQTGDLPLTPPAQNVGSFAERMAQAADSLQIPSGPGGWAKNLVATNMHALSGQPAPTAPAPTAPQSGWKGAVSKIGNVANAVSTSLGDAAHANDTKGGGWLSGVTNTLATRGERLAKEETDRYLHAETQMRTVALTRNAYRQDQQDRLASYGQVKSRIDSMRQDHAVQDNISQSQLTQLLKDHRDYLNTHTGGPVGEEPQLDGNGKPMVDPKGNPVMSPIYSLAEVKTKDGSDGNHEITKSESDYLKRNGQELPPGTKLDTSKFLYISTKAQGVEDARRRIEKSNDDEMTSENQRQIASELQDHSIQSYIASIPGEPLAGLYGAQKNAQAHIAAIDQKIALGQKAGAASSPEMQAIQQKRQQFTAEQQKINHVITFGFNDKAKQDYAKSFEEQRKQDEVERKNKVDEAIKIAADKAKKGGFDGDPNAATPEAFLASLDPDARSLIQLIGTGRAPLNNPGYLLARKPEIMEAVAKAYPDFDISKIKGYQDTYTDFTKGKTSVALNSGGTALGHLRELQQLNTAKSHIAHTPAWTAYQNKVDTVASELAKFYGDATIPAIASIKETLGSTLPGNRQAAIDTQAQSMGDKLDAFETQWTNAAPSKAYQAPMPGISLKAKQARAALDPTYASQHPELGIPPAVDIPKNTVHVQIPGQPAGYVSATKLAEFQKAHPDAKVIQ